MKRILVFIRQLAYSIFTFSYYVGLGIDLSIRGFFLLTLGGKTAQNKYKYHCILQRKSKFVINHVPGTTFSYFNQHKETFEKPCMIISNHQSQLDLMAIMMLSPKLIILTKKWVWNNPIFGAVVRYADYYPISDYEKFRHNLEENVKEGYSIMIFPEGTRSQDGQIGRFHRGAFYLAQMMNLDIVPVFIDGFSDVMPKGALFIRNGNMSLKVLPRIKSENVDDAGYRLMAKNIHALYQKMKNEKVCNNR